VAELVLLGISLCLSADPRLRPWPQHIAQLFCIAHIAEQQAQLIVSELAEYQVMARQGVSLLPAPQYWLGISAVSFAF
jgi:hypothetical protein